MKQHITKEQIEELSEKGKEKYYEWVFRTTRREMAENFRFTFEDIIARESLPIVNIGQMIEFLNQKGRYFQHLSFDFPFGWQVWHTNDGDFKGQNLRRNIGKTACDALWEAVKEVLENG